MYAIWQEVCAILCGKIFAFNNTYFIQKETEGDALRFFGNA